MFTSVSVILYKSFLSASESVSYTIMKTDSHWVLSTICFCLVLGQCRVESGRRGQKSRNFQPKVGKSRNFSVFKVGKIRNFYYNFSNFNLSINSKVFPFELFNYHNCLQLSIELYKINFIDVLLNMASIYCWVINHFPSRTFNKLLSF